MSDFFKRDKKLCNEIFENLYRIIEIQSKDAWSALCYISFLYHSDIPIFLLKKCINIEEFQEMVLNILKNNGLVETYKIKNEYCLRVHEKTQELVKNIRVYDVAMTNI